MHATEKRTSQYKTLSAMGVWCGELRAHMNQDTRWTLQFSWASHVTRAEAKEAMKAFLESQYEAFDMSFWGKQGEYSRGYVRFSTWCL